MRKAVLTRTKLGSLALVVELGCTAPNPAYHATVARPDAAAEQADAPAAMLATPDAALDLAADLPPPRPDLAPDVSPDTRPSPAGLVAHWRLDEPGGLTVADETGSNPGTLRNGVGHEAPGFPRARFRNPGAISFDGQDDYVDLGVLGLPEMQAVKSVSLWCRAAASWTTGRRNLIAFNNPTARESLQLGVDRGYPAVWTWGPAPAPLIGPARLDLEWHHLVYVYDGARQRLFVDGAEVATLPQPPPSATVDRAHLGTYDQNHNELWSGMMDDVRIYERALTPDEIAWLYAGYE